MTYPSELDDIRMEEIERRLKTAEHRLLAFPWKDWPPDRIKDLVEDLRTVVDYIQRRFNVKPLVSGSIYVLCVGLDGETAQQTMDRLVEAIKAAPMTHQYMTLAYGADITEAIKAEKEIGT